METGDIIYFLIVIIISIIGVFEKKNKKRKTADKGSPHFPLPDVLQRTVRETVPSPAPPPSPLDLARKKETIKERLKHYSSSSTLDSIFAQEGDSDIPDELYAIGNAESMYSNKKTTLHPLISDLKKGNIRQEIQKGIIYSEILNRKY